MLRRYLLRSLRSIPGNQVLSAPRQSVTTTTRTFVATRPVKLTISTQSRWQSVYRQSIHQQTRSYRQPFNYQRFQQNKALFRRWAQHPHFYYHVAGIALVGGAAYTYNLEEVPVSNRRRFRIVSYKTEASLGQDMYRETLQQFSGQLLPPNHPLCQKVKRVAERLIPHSGLEGEQWEINVINSPEKNAFVIPGGKIFVFSGIMDVCRTDDSLAAVIGHEIGHNVAHHAAERASSSLILGILAQVVALATGTDLGLGSVLLDLVFLKPGSRSQESEADYIGLLMMSKACYDPEAAVQMWATMDAMEKSGIPQFLSTHPSNHNRMEKLTTWLPKAEAARDESGCSSIQPFAQQFMSQAMSFR